LWDKYGISSFAKNPENTKEINYNKFVRYDEYGMYGILN
jgi:hypothetical protein